METLLYWLARALVTLLRVLPLPVVARLGRAGGALAWWVDARHRRVALHNLQRVFGATWSPVEIRALAREHFRRLGENYACGVKTALMTPTALRPHVTFLGHEKFLAHTTPAGPASCIVALGHFGNFELYARFGQFVPAYQCLTTYRALRPPRINRLFQEQRERSGCRFFERRSEAGALRAALRPTSQLLGLLADQRAAHGSVRLPFLGHECLTSTAVALFALRYRWPLHPAICYRTAPARWQIEVGDEIPTRLNGRARPVADIMQDVNRAFERAVLRDPANWFWVHDRWKLPKPEMRAPKPESPRAATMAEGK